MLGFPKDPFQRTPSLVILLNWIRELRISFLQLRLKRSLSLESNYLLILSLKLEIVGLELNEIVD